MLMIDNIIIIMQLLITRLVENDTNPFISPILFLAEYFDNNLISNVSIPPFENIESIVIKVKIK